MRSLVEHAVKDFFDARFGRGRQPASTAGAQQFDLHGVFSQVRVWMTSGSVVRVGRHEANAGRMPEARGNALTQIECDANRFYSVCSEIKKESFKIAIELDPLHEMQVVAHFLQKKICLKSDPEKCKEFSALSFKS